MAAKVAVVTGSNKGIGFAIVKELCRRGVGTVYLTARDTQKGLEAVEEIKRSGYNPKFYQLDVSNENSVKAFAEHLKKTHSTLDILINNAGVITEDFYKTTYEDSKYVIDVNYKSILTKEKHMFPILSENARVLHISSDCGHISNINNKYWVERLIRDDLKREDIDEFINWYLDSVKNNTIDFNDFAENSIVAYRVSKIALCALTRIQQKEIGRNISVNCLHPGLVSTNMTNGIGNFTIDDACKTPVRLVLDVDQSVKGKYFWFDGTEKEWTNHNLKVYPTAAFIQDPRNKLNPFV